MSPSDPPSIPTSGYTRLRTGLIVLAVAAGVILLGALHVTGVLGPG